MRIQLDPSALAQRQIGIDEVADAISEQNVNLPTGVLNGPEQGVHGPGERPAAGRGVVPPAGRRRIATARRCTSATWARCSTTSQNNKSSALVQQHTRGVILAIQRQPGSNTVAVADAVKALMTELQTQMPASVGIVTMYDRAVSIRESVRRREVHAAADARARRRVIFLFLRNVSAT